MARPRSRSSCLRPFPPPLRSLPCSPMPAPCRGTRSLPLQPRYPLSNNLPRTTLAPESVQSCAATLVLERTAGELAPGLEQIGEFFRQKAAERDAAIELLD